MVMVISNKLQQLKKHYNLNGQYFRIHTHSQVVQLQKLDMILITTVRFKFSQHLWHLKIEIGNPLPKVSWEVMIKWNRCKYIGIVLWRLCKIIERRWIARILSDKVWIKVDMRRWEKVCIIIITFSHLTFFRWAHPSWVKSVIQFKMSKRVGR